MWEDAADTLRAVSAVNPLPVSVTGTGDASAENQEEEIAFLQSIDNTVQLLGSSAQLADVVTAVEALATTVAGAELQVDVASLPALAAGAAAIGTVGVTAVVPGTAATSLGKAEDAVHTSGDVGVMMLGVRSDSGTVSAANGDYLPPSMTSTGAIRTDIGATGSVGLLAGANAVGSVTVSSLPAAFNTGASSATTLRSVAASDSPDVAHLANVVTAVQIMDDWDESDRLKANIIVGQAGITAGAGAVAANTPRVTLASDSPDVTHLATIAGDTTDIEAAVELIDDVIIADDAAFTPAVTKVAMVGFEFDDSSPDSVNEGDAGAARMSANRNIYTTLRDAAGNERGANVNASNQLNVVSTTAETLYGAVAETAPASDTASSGLNGRLQRIAQRLTSLIALLPTALAANGGLKVELASALDATNDSIALDARATVGATPFRLLDVDESEDEVKGSAGALYSLVAVNRDAATEHFLKIYDNTAAGTTVGTTTPVFVVSLKAATGFAMNFNTPMKFSTGICIAATTGLADNDTGAPGANEIMVSGSYK
jgi:hypothetical protein